MTTFFVLDESLDVQGRSEAYCDACTAAVALACGTVETHKVVSRVDGGDEFATDAPLNWHLQVIPGDQP